MKHQQIGAVTLDLAAGPDTITWSVWAQVRVGTSRGRSREPLYRRLLVGSTDSEEILAGLIKRARESAELYARAEVAAGTEPPAKPQGPGRGQDVTRP